jgi:hypothetical protein
MQPVFIVAKHFGDVSNSEDGGDRSHHQAA